MLDSESSSTSNKVEYKAWLRECVTERERERLGRTEPEPGGRRDRPWNPDGRPRPPERRRPTTRDLKERTRASLPPSSTGGYWNTKRSMGGAPWRRLRRRAWGRRRRGMAGSRPSLLARQLQQALQRHCGARRERETPLQWAEPCEIYPVW